MESHEMQKNQSLRASIGVIVIIIGFILMIGSGEPDPNIPNTLWPTFKSVGFGLAIMIIGGFIFGFKKLIHEIKKAIKE